MGRSSKNDVSIADAAMSRFQCRFFFKPGEGLWVSDLGSVNGTTVNGQPVQDHQLQVQDEIIAGDTRLRVVGVLEPAASRPDEMGVKAVDGPDQGLDLGLKKVNAVSRNAAPELRRKLTVLAGLMVVVAGLSWVPWGGLVAKLPWNRAEPAPLPIEKLPDLDLAFERVEGSVSNLFRYYLELRDDRLVVQVDDLESNRHIRREKKVASGLVRDLARSLEATRVFDLREDYAGLAPGILESSDLAIVIGVNACRVKVVNHLAPDEFAAARAMIEEFGKNELGLAALAIDPVTLVEKSKAALLQAKKMWDEREVRDENLFNAIRSFKECAWYLETIEPKPEFYAEAVSGKTDCERELQRRYEDVLFMSERAVKLRDWKEAERQLRTICEMIPDRSDERNEKASKTLVDVQRHLSTEK